jgi:heterodisulfide reductase subunit A2
MAKIGVFLCHCGKNIAGTVDVPKLAEELKKDPNLVVLDQVFTCSEEGQEKIKEKLRSGEVDRVVVASCSPVHHGDIFASCVGEVINPFEWEMANIREQCAWLYTDKNESTPKALALIKGAINRVRYHQPIGSIMVPMNRDVLVVGGGIAGLHTSLELAHKGFKVFLIEKEPNIGGNMVKLDRTFPTNDCSMCTISPILNAVNGNKNIELHTLSEVTEFKG